MDVLVLILAAAATALATGLGVIPVTLLGERAVGLRPALLGVAAGVMTVASVLGLLVPGLEEGSPLEVLGGVALGVVFLLWARRRIDEREARLGLGRSRSVRTSILVFLVLFVHSLPEGLAIGTAYASDTEGLSLFVIVAIAIHNIPEGTSIAVPMSSAGYSTRRQFWAAVGTSLPQPVGAPLAYLLVEQVEGLLPASFGFAAGAMLALVAWELLPDSLRENVRGALTGLVAGGLAMVGLAAALNV
jgi:zinc transporter, ZIP family